MPQNNGTSDGSDCPFFMVSGCVLFYTSVPHVVPNPKEENKKTKNKSPRMSEVDMYLVKTPPFSPSEVRESSRRHMAYDLNLNFVIDWESEKGAKVNSQLASIAACMKRFREEKHDEVHVKTFVARKAVEFILCTNLGENVGTQTLQSTEQVLNDKELQTDNQKSVEETKALKDAMDYVFAHYFDEVQQLEQEDEKGVFPLAISMDLVKNTHARICPGKYGGVFRSSERFVDFRGVPLKCHAGDHVYPCGAITEARSQGLIDVFNEHVLATPIPSTAEDEVSFLFRCAAWLLFFFIDVHPFSDGNGRLCRLLANRALMSAHPFPVPLRNKRAYIDALLDTRKNNGNPFPLFALLVESSLRGWNELYSGCHPMSMFALTVQQNCLDNSVHSQLSLHPRFVNMIQPKRKRLLKVIHGKIAEMMEKKQKFGSSDIDQLSIQVLIYLVYSS